MTRVDHGCKPVVAPPYVFYSDPHAPRGLWIRTDICTALVACSYCGSEQWEPCRSKTAATGALGAHHSSVHTARRKDAAKVQSTGPTMTINLGAGGGLGCFISLPLPPQNSKGKK